MDRAKDFGEFMSDLRPLEESIYAMPDVPGNAGVTDDMAYLRRVRCEHPIAADPYEPSSIREEGLKIWDSVYLPMPKCVSFDLRRPRDMPALRSINSEWEKTKEALSMVGRPDGVHYLRPKGKYILDMMNDDLRMLQGAHIIAHRCQLLAADEYTFGKMSDTFLHYLVKLFATRLYGLKVNVRPNNMCQDSFSWYGIDIAVSTDLRSPVMVTDNLMPDHTVAVLLGSVGIEAHPSQAAKDGPVSWKETNKWSCLPTLVALAGWECVDYITHAERVEVLGEPTYAVPCGDLQPMSGFADLLGSAEACRGAPPNSPYVLTVEEWFKSEDFAKGLSETPLLPCPYCLKLNDRAEGVVRRPRSYKPKMKLKDARKSTIPEAQEWVEYVDFMNRCIKIGRAATTHALGSVTSVKKREAAFKRKEKRMHKLAVLAKKRMKKLTSGFISEAEGIMREIEKLNKEDQK